MKHPDPPRPDTGSESGTPPGTRRKYEPPRLETVKINFEEVVLVACKDIGSGGAPVSSCALGCAVDGS